jgi:hypothetical protein
MDKFCAKNKAPLLSGRFYWQMQLLSTLLSFSNMGGVTVSSGTLSADARGYSFRAKGSESCYRTVGIIA